MADLLSVQNWYSNFRNSSKKNQPPSSAPPSASSSSSPVNRLWKSRTASNNPPRPSPSPSRHDEPADFSLSTLRDPRKPSVSASAPATSPHLSRSTSPAAPRHPDLSNEVAALSEKLIQSINNSSVLDDSLQDARLQLVQLRASLDKERSQRCAIEKEKRDLEFEVESLTAALFEEANKMVIDAKKEREAIEKKNEQLRAQVTDTEVLLASHQEQLAQLKAVMQEMHCFNSRDRDRDHNHNRDDLDSRTIRTTSTSSRPHTPTTRPSTATATATAAATIDRLMEAMNISSTYSAVSQSTFSEDFVEPPPAPPTSYSHLIKPVCREDLPAYDDYKSMLNVIRSLMEFRSATGSTPISSASSAHTSTTAIPSIANRVASATSSYLGTSPSSLSTYSAGAGAAAAGLTSSSASISSKTPALSRSASSNTLNRRTSLATLSPYQSVSSNSPSLSVSSATSTSNAGVRGDQGFSYTALRETRFYKRILTEDIEPALRLDLAPGLSWLTRRSVLSSISDGILVIEPLPQVIPRDTPPACTLCGERRPHSAAPGSSDVIAQQQHDNNNNNRTHAFRTSTSETAQRYPLCQLCLEKMRACCEFVGYLRMIVDGHVHVRDAAEEKEVWEEIVRLRERIFWARIGGGVVPAFVPLIQQLKAQQRENEAMLLQQQLQQEEERQREDGNIFSTSTSHHDHDDSAISASASASSALSSVAHANPSYTSMATTTDTTDNTDTTTSTSTTTDNNDNTNFGDDKEEEEEKEEVEKISQLDAQEISLASEENSSNPQSQEKGDDDKPEAPDQQPHTEEKEELLARLRSNSEYRSSVAYRRHLKSLSALSERSEVSSSKADDEDDATAVLANGSNVPAITTTDTDEQPAEADVGSPGEAVVQEGGIDGASPSSASTAATEEMRKDHSA